MTIERPFVDDETYMLLYSLVRNFRFHEAEKLLMEAGLQPNDAYDRVDEIASRLGYDEPVDRW